MNATQTKASEFIDAAHKAGFTITVRDSIVTITKRFAPGDTAAWLPPSVPHTEPPLSGASERTIGPAIIGGIS